MILMVLSDVNIRTLSSLFSSFIIFIMHAGVHALNFHRMPLMGHRDAFQGFGSLIFVSTFCRSSHFKCTCMRVCTHINMSAFRCSHLSDDCLLSRRDLSLQVCKGNPEGPGQCRETQESRTGWAKEGARG